MPTQEVGSRQALAAFNLHFGEIQQAVATTYQNTVGICVDNRARSRTSIRIGDDLSLVNLHLHVLEQA